MSVQWVLVYVKTCSNGPRTEIREQCATHCSVTHFSGEKIKMTTQKVGERSSMGEIQWKGSQCRARHGTNQATPSHPLRWASVPPRWASVANVLKEKAMAKRISFYLNCFVAV